MDPEDILVEAMSMPLIGGCLRWVVGGGLSLAFAAIAAYLGLMAISGGEARFVAAGFALCSGFSAALTFLSVTLDRRPPKALPLAWIASVLATLVAAVVSAG